MYYIVHLIKIGILILASEGAYSEKLEMYPSLLYDLKDIITHIITIIVVYFIKTVYRMVKCLSNSNLSWFSAWWDGCIPNPDNLS